MNPMPENDTVPAATAAQRKSLERWLLEWDLACRAGEREAVESRSGRSGGQRDGTDAPFDAVVRKGDVRLLDPNLVPVAGRPVYVAVLSDWDGGRWLVAPFSAFSVPATRGELATGCADLPLMTLCLWNARDVSAAALSRSWLVDHMGDAELTSAWAVFRHVAIGDALPASLLDRIGPPILHADDPRREYQREETARLAALVDWNVEIGNGSGEREVPLFSVVAPHFKAAEELAQAAGSGEEWSPCIYATRDPDTGQEQFIVNKEQLRAKWIAGHPLKIMPGANKGLCAEWWYAGQPIANQATIYAAISEIPIGTAVVVAKPGGLLIQMDGAELPEGAAPIEKPSDLFILLR